MELEARANHFKLTRPKSKGEQSTQPAPEWQGMGDDSPATKDNTDRSRENEGFAQNGEDFLCIVSVRLSLFRDLSLSLVLSGDKSRNSGDR
ncbi:hypothetical protein NL676_030392 [Syzygium grande]|nr:hypothetical protein NL676_030392 [Syzygium grande]